jgi:hypothetical protein
MASHRVCKDLRWPRPSKAPEQAGTPAAPKCEINPKKQLTWRAQSAHILGLFNFVPTRRKFLLDCSSLMAAALAAPTGVMAESAACFWKSRSLQDITCSDLAGQLNTPFRLQAAPGRTVTVTLAEVKLHPARPLKPGRRPPPDADHERFSAVFSGARSELLAQNIYPFEHRTLGRFELFIVPINTRNPAKIDYEAVVNRPRIRAGKTDS